MQAKLNVILETRIEKQAANQLTIPSNYKK